MEGLAAFAAATGAYVTLDGQLWLYLLLALAPDLSMLGYLLGTRAGSVVYNAAHTYVSPLLLLVAGTVWSVPLAVLVGFVWTAHIGVDRAVGYGLKYPTSFRDTHIGRVGESTATPAQGDVIPTVDPDPAD